jgi:hypothetical protein
MEPWFFLVILMGATVVGPFDSEGTCEGQRELIEQRYGIYGVYVSDKCWHGRQPIPWYDSDDNPKILI